MSGKRLQIDRAPGIAVTFRPLGDEGRTALCRCGGTASQRFCDDSRKRVGFQSRTGPGD